MRAYVLRARGVLDTSQFFPSGLSDADTLRVRVERGGISVQERGKRGVRATRVFDGANVIGRGTHPAIDENGFVRVRLQGVDAPELHYMPSADDVHGISRNFRQPYGESAARALGARLRRIGKGPIACVIESRVGSPGDLFDTYGRCVADVFVSPRAKPVHINDWLLRSGWVIPSLYNSLEPDELARIVASAARARKAGSGMWRHYTAHIERFAWSSVFRPATDASDGGKVMHPKFFRRLAAWSFQRRAKLFTESFAHYLASPSVREYLHRTDEFLSNGATAAPVHSLASIVERGALTLGPAEMVFREAPAHLEDARGREVTSW